MVAPRTGGRFDFCADAHLHRNSKHGGATARSTIQASAQTCVGAAGGHQTEFTARPSGLHVGSGRPLFISKTEQRVDNPTYSRAVRQLGARRMMLQRQLSLNAHGKGRPMKNARVLNDTTRARKVQITDNVRAIATSPPAESAASPSAACRQDAHPRFPR